MEKDKVQEYINKLMELNSKIEDVDDESLEDDELLNDNFIQTLNNVLTSLNKDVEQEMMKSVMETTPQTQVHTSLISVLPVKIKKLNENAVTPSYSKDGDAGMDLVATEIISETTDQITYGTGISMEIPKGYVGLVFPRSSIRKYELELTNSVGVIDSGYRGEIQATFNKVHQKLNKYNVGDRIAQIMIIPYPQVSFIEVDELSSSERGSGGFGSTGN